MKVEPTGRIHQYLEVRGQDPYALLFKLPNVSNGKSFRKFLFSSVTLQTSEVLTLITRIFRKEGEKIVFGGHLYRSGAVEMALFAAV